MDELWFTQMKTWFSSNSLTWNCYKIVLICSKSATIKMGNFHLNIGSSSVSCYPQFKNLSVIFDSIFPVTWSIYFFFNSTSFRYHSRPPHTLHFMLPFPSSLLLSCFSAHLSTMVNRVVSPSALWFSKSLSSELRNIALSFVLFFLTCLVIYFSVFLLFVFIYLYLGFFPDRSERSEWTLLLLLLLLL